MTTHLDETGIRLGPLGPRVVRFGLIFGLVCLAAAALFGALARDHWQHFLRAYLTAYMFVLAISLGSLFFVMIQHATRAGWSVTVRRVAEGFAMNLLWLPFGFLPIVAGLFWGHMYHWTDPALFDVTSPDFDAIVNHKQAYLNTGFWIVRAVVFFAIWALLARFYFRNSVAQDESGDVGLTLRMQRFAPIGLILYALSQTYASVDWIKTLDPHWFSTMFGVYFFALSCCAAFATFILAFYFLHRNGKLHGVVTPEHWQDLGKLLFAFGVVFWAYIAFSQYMLIWYANIPEETAWYITRTVGGWRFVGWVLIVGHFGVPFIYLVTRHTKRQIGVLAIIAAWMLALGAVDAYYLTMPIVEVGMIGQAESIAQIRGWVASGELDVGLHPHPMDALLVLGFLGLTVAGAARTLGSCRLVPARDPRLAEALAFENM